VYGKISIEVINMARYNAGGYENLSAAELMNKMEAKAQRTKTAGKIMRYLRKKVKLSQKELAEKISIAQPTYAGYENGHHEPSLDILIQLAKFHGVTLDYLSGRLFDEWLIEPFSNMKEEEQSQTELLEHVKRQYQNANYTSDMVMQARMHGEYSTYKDTYPTEHRDRLRKELHPPGPAN
jgi:transcriptional regulator with XRE-family HTH domain